MGWLSKQKKVDVQRSFLAILSPIAEGELRRNINPSLDALDELAREPDTDNLYSMHHKYILDAISEIESMNRKLDAAWNASDPLTPELNVSVDIFLKFTEVLSQLQSKFKTIVTVKTSATKKRMTILEIRRLLITLDLLWRLTDVLRYWGQLSGKEFKPILDGYPEMKALKK